jgi:hypothetical protein
MAGHRETSRSGRVLVASVAGLAISLGGLLAVCAVLPTQALGAVLLQSTTYEARAARQLERRDAADLPQALRDTRSGLALNPYNGVAWLRLAWIESRLSHGKLSAAAVEAVQRSYDVAPYGPQVTAWRISFLLEHWAETPTGLRHQLASEMAAAWPERSKAVSSAVRKTRNRDGRLAGMVIVMRLKRENR